MDQSFESVLLNGDEEALNELKRFLFEENIRLSLRQKEMDEMVKKFNEERTTFMNDMNAINLKIVNERKRLKDEEAFFAKKMEILKNGFTELENDRQRFQREKMSFEAEKRMYSESNNSAAYEDLAGTFFAGVNNPLALRKRYRDLLKIFHPDNLCGDSNMVTIINREYERLKNEIEYPFKNVY
ncbi:MAG: hypothetical protein MJ123_02700 [Lachnospiraceae bacterium]|nr:hypothetical protein [Lachnospiraceae bacterium]